MTATGDARGIDLPDDAPVRAKLQPIRHGELPDAQLVALLTLPRDRFFDGVELAALGVELVMSEDG